MIQVTLNFPDQAALLAFFARPVVVVPTEVEAPKPAKAEKTTAATTAPKTSPAPTPTKTTEVTDPKPELEPTAPSTTSSAKPSVSVDYPTLQKAVFALAGKSRDAAAAVAKDFGVKTFKELPEAKWGDALVAVNAALAEAA